METNQPQDIAAEQALLGCLLLDPSRLTEVRANLNAEDFYQPRHELVYAQICQMADTSQPIDPVTVAAALVEAGTITKIGGHSYIHTLFSGLATATNAKHYADIVAERALRRKLLVVSERLAQVVGTPTALEGQPARDQMLNNVANLSLELEVLVEERGLLHEPITDVLTWDQLHAKPERPQSWIVPGFIASQDVHMMLGGEGSGKSFISRQLAQCVAYGVHPWKPGVAIDPRRTLLVDLEVDEETLKDDTRDMLARIKRFSKREPEPAYVWHHPAGLNLRDRKDVAEFERRVDLARPALICFGSLYNAYYGGGDSYEHIASDLRQVFNRIRMRFGCALWLEHHMPQPNLAGERPARPYGSSQWAAWCTHGTAMKYLGPTQYELARFRNDRGRREYPAGVQRGGRLPVSPIWDDEIQLVREANAA